MKEFKADFGERHSRQKAQVAFKKFEQGTQRASEYNRKFREYLTKCQYTGNEDWILVHYQRGMNRTYKYKIRQMERPPKTLKKWMEKHEEFELRDEQYRADDAVFGAAPSREETTAPPTKIRRSASSTVKPTTTMVGKKEDTPASNSQNLCPPKHPRTTLEDSEALEKPKKKLKTEKGTPKVFFF